MLWSSSRDERGSSPVRRGGVWGTRTRPPYLSLARPIRLVLAEDQYLVREGMRRLLETQADLEIAAVCADLGSLLAAVDQEGPDVSSPTSACRQETPTRASRPLTGCAIRTRTSESSCSASTRRRGTCSPCSKVAARGAPTS